jgi:hypothetical protein
MSTTYLIPVEGNMAMPGPHAYAYLPSSFGQRWTLLPDNISLRPEIRALYAALLRTMCLSATAIRSMCHWEPLRKPVSAQQTVYPAKAEAETASPLPPAAASASVMSLKSLSKALLASGTIAAICIVLAAGFVWMHPTARPATGRSASGDATTVLADSPATEPVANVSTQAHEDAQPAPAKAAANIARSDMQIANEPPRSSAEKTVVAKRNSRNEVAPENPRVSRHADTSATAPHRFSAAASEAGAFSPQRAKEHPVDDYASIQTWAQTTRSEAMPALSQGATRTNDTDWMNHIKQRRITDAPEGFNR